MTGFDLSGGIMAGTFSQIYIQIVFAVQGRQNLLQKEWRDEVFKYMYVRDHQEQGSEADHRQWCF